MDLEEVTEQKRLTAEEWRKHFDGCKNSGKMVIDYCRENGLTTHKYYYWRKRLCGNKAEGTQVGFVECRIKAVPVTSPLILECGNGYRLHIGAGLEAKTLGLVLEVIARC